jgi:DsbC/DsbD-like thiol-disulfide interchange protein
VRILSIGFWVGGLLCNCSSAAEPIRESVKLEKATLALLDGGGGANGEILAGLSISLADHVRTYWRTPGESGLPPFFDFSASRNVDHVDIEWPTPSRMTEADSIIFGYENDVIIPLRVTPKDATRPVSLTLTIDFGLCDTLCTPAKAVLTRELGSGGAARSSIESFLARVPKQVAIKSDDSPAVIAIETHGGPPASLVVSIRSKSSLHDVIIEGPDAWYFGQGVQTKLDGESYRVMIPVEQKPSSGTFAGLKLVVTAISEDGATETHLALDAAGSIR